MILGSDFRKFDLLEDPFVISLYDDELITIFGELKNTDTLNERPNRHDKNSTIKTNQYTFDNGALIYYEYGESKTFSEAIIRYDNNLLKYGLCPGLKKEIIIKILGEPEIIDNNRFIYKGTDYEAAEYEFIITFENESVNEMKYKVYYFEF